MESEEAVAAREQRRAEGREWLDSASPYSSDDQTSVPQAPASAQSRSVAKGPGSLGGTLCADPKMTFSGAGKAIVKVRIAVSERYQDPDTGKWLNGPAQFTDVTVWGRQGEYVMECLCKGDRVVVNGIWQETTWVGKDGQEHTTRSLTARDIGPSLMFRQARVIRDKEGS